MFGFRGKSEQADTVGPIRHVHLIDTSIASDNVGDEIIVEACRAEITPLFCNAYVSTSSGHDGLGPFGRTLAADSDVVLLLGTNALSARDQQKRRFVWNVAKEDVPALERKVVLFGVGANRAFETVDTRQKRFLKQVLSDTFTHSVRDGLALDILRSCGLNGINTSCPTLWRYAGIPPNPPVEKASAACFTLTKHKPAAEDADLVAVLRRCYERLFFWPQQPRDLSYLDEVAGRDGIEIIAPNLRAYDEFLSHEVVDVVGTRLHGTIRGLHFGRRSLVVAIDNRATSIGMEVGIPTLARTDVPTMLQQHLDGKIRPKVSVSEDRITAFLSQFH